MKENTLADFHRQGNVYRGMEQLGTADMAVRRRRQLCVYELKKSSTLPADFNLCPGTLLPGTSWITIPDFQIAPVVIHYMLTCESHPFFSRLFTILF